MSICPKQTDDFHESCSHRQQNHATYDGISAVALHQQQVLQFFLASGSSSASISSRYSSMSISSSSSPTPSPSFYALSSSNTPCSSQEHNCQGMSRRLWLTEAKHVHATNRSKQYKLILVYYAAVN